jgi:hypothetical protein
MRGGKKCVSGGNEERSESIGLDRTAPKCGGLAIRENEIWHGEFSVDQFQHLGANFVH